MNKALREFGEIFLFPMQNFTSVSASAQQGQSGKTGQTGLVCTCFNVGRYSG